MLLLNTFERSAILAVFYVISRTSIQIIQGTLFCWLPMKCIGVEAFTFGRIVDAFNLGVWGKHVNYVYTTIEKSHATRIQGWKLLVKFDENTAKAIRFVLCLRAIYCVFKRIKSRTIYAIVRIRQENGHGQWHTYSLSKGSFVQISRKINTFNRIVLKRVVEFLSWYKLYDATNMY